MRYCDAKSTKLLISMVVLTAVSFAAGWPSVSVKALTGGDSSVINAMLCEPGSQVSLANPPSDSVVATGAVSLSGTVKQASQIEVKIDDMFDSVIAVAVGQETFEGVIQLSAGTHTITLTAIDMCGGVNATASSVVTYTPPPSVPSAGADAETDVNKDTSKPGSGATITSPGDRSADPDPVTAPFLPQVLLDPLNAIFRWLNLSTGDGQELQSSRMSLLRAATLTVGVYMTAFGAAAGVVRSAVNWQLLKRVKKRQRAGYVRQSYRVIGILLIILTLLWP